MKCQANVERVTGSANLRRVIVTTEYGPCTRNAVAKLGGLCMCTQHVKLALDGLVDEKGHVADRGSIRDVRKYPKKFPGGIYPWTKGLTPEPIDTPPPEPRILHNGDGKILVGFTTGELRNILHFVPTRSIRERCVTALALLDPESAKEFDVDL